MDIMKFVNMEPMRYYNNDTGKKREEVIENLNNEYIATEKHDGDWGMFIHGDDDFNLIRSRSISKVTGNYGDYTQKLPHLVEEMKNWPKGTVVLAEICWPVYGTNANTVGTILRCLPPKAIERQKENKLYGFIFDVLAFNGQDISNLPYEQRLLYFEHLISNYFKPTAIFENAFLEAATQIIEKGGEGVVIQRRDNPYLPGTRTAWKTLKLKQSMDSQDYQVVGLIKPTRLYDGKAIETWDYWVDEHDLRYQRTTETATELLNKGYVPVTKPYYFNWKNGITIILPSGILTDVASGLTDEDRAWLATDEAAVLLKKNAIFAEVKAMGINDLGRLRHAYLVRLRISYDM